MEKFLKRLDWAVLVLMLVVFLHTCEACGSDGENVSSEQDPRLPAARTLIYDGNFSSGTALLKEILAEDPASRDALLLMATAEEWQGELNEALKTYRVIVSLYENDVEAWRQVAKLEGWTGNYDRAISIYGDLISRFGEDPALLVGIARTLSWSNRLDEALRYYDRALAKEPANVEALAGKAQILRWTGRTHEARRLIGDAWSIDSLNSEVKREREELELALSPRVSVSYTETLERDYLRSRNMYYYNLGNRKLLARATFFHDILEDMTFDLWGSKDWELDRNLEVTNFDVSSVGFGAAVGVRVAGPVKIGGDLRIVQYENTRENVVYPFASDVTRNENSRIWLLAEYGAWSVDVGVGTWPVFLKRTRALPVLNYLDVGRQTVVSFTAKNRFAQSLQGSLGWELGRYSDDNERRNLHVLLELDPVRPSWLSASYFGQFQDFSEASVNYFAPLEEFRQRAAVDVRRARGGTFLGAGLSLGSSHSSNFGSIFTVGASGTLSRALCPRLRMNGTGFVSYDDNKYFVHGFTVLFELRL
ncbi:MAG: tetratricopeptide repeat protein [Candidatus Eisenbacteria bacterium]